MMKGMFFGTIVAAAFLALAGCATTEKSLRDRGLSPLTQSELEALYARTRTMRGRIANGTLATGTYTQDGVAKIDWGQGADEGSWRITEGKFCTKYKTVRNGVETCFTIYKTSDNEYTSFLPDGSLNATASFTN